MLEEDLIWVLENDHSLIFMRSAFIQYWKGPFVYENKHLQGEVPHDLKIKIKKNV